MTDLSGKIALVTGGSRGIGRAIALELAGRGAAIAFNYLRNHRAAAEAVEEIESLGVRCLRVRAHLGDETKITQLFNARAAWLCAVEASKLMADGGHVVNITSEGSRRVLPYYFSVGVSKAALEAVTRYLAVELAPKGISVNAVSGGYVDTGALDHFPTKEEMLESGRNTPVGRMVTARDIANAVVFLCSPQAEMIRGR